MTLAITAVPPHVRSRLAAALEVGVLGLPASAAAVRSTLGSAADSAAACTALDELSELGVSARAAAAWLRSIDVVAASFSKPDLVWSGPRVEGVPSRDTRQAYDELVGTAQRSLWVSSYAYFDGPRVFELLARRMESVPDLTVTLLLNIQRHRGDTSAPDALVRRFADQFWGRAWPGTTKPTVYYDPRSLDLDRPESVLHAKSVVADDEAVFVTSANLTEAAFDRNIEVGLLLRDRALALSITSHLRGLIERGVLSPLPAS